MNAPRPYIEIPLHGSRGGVALVTAGFAPVVDYIRWYQTAGGYAFSPKYGFMHRRLMAAEANESVDHKNFNRLDNRHENLRSGPPCLNNKHRRKTNERWPYKGVRQQENSPKWQARITIDRKTVHLGTFDTAESAARAYDAAALAAFRDYACLNFGENK